MVSFGGGGGGGGVGGSGGGGVFGRFAGGETDREGDREGGFSGRDDLECLEGFPFDPDDLDGDLREGEPDPLRRRLVDRVERDFEA